MEHVPPLLSSVGLRHKKVSAFIPHLVLLLVCFVSGFISICRMMGSGPTDMSPSYVWGVLAAYALGLFLCICLFRSGIGFLSVIALCAFIIQSLAVLLTLMVLIGPAD